MKALKTTVLLFLFLTMIPVASPATSIRVPVLKLAPVQDVALRGTKDISEFSVPIPKRWNVKRASLHFNYTNSSALIEQTSRLVFLIHDQPLAQIRLNPNVPVGEVVVEIPGELLKEGYNTCQFLVTQHYTIEECEDPFAPELWTWINLEKAYFIFDVDPVPVPPRVSAIADFLFDSRNIFDTTVNIIIPELTPEYIKLASLAASGIALRYDYRPVDFILSEDIRMGCDNIVIGNHQDLRKLLQFETPATTGAAIRIRNLPREMSAPMGSATFIAEDPYNALVILSGNDFTELTQTVSAFASLSHPFPNSPTAEIAKLELPEIEAGMLKKGLLPGNTYSLASLGMSSVLFRGISPPSATISLRLPSDLSLSPNKFAVVVLHMAYDAAMRSDSVLNIKLNGKFISGIRLDNSKGDYFKGYKVNIPLSAFKPGHNQLAFEAVLTPLHTDKCVLIQTNNLRLTIFDDSTLTIPEIPYWIKMPKVEVFFQDAFPFGKWPDLRETIAAVPEKTFAAATAAVNLIAISAQKIGYPPFNLSFQFELNPEQEPKDVIMIGSLETIPTKILENAPLAGINPTRIQYRQLDRPKAKPKKPFDFWLDLAKAIPELPQNMSDRSETTNVTGEYFGALAPQRAVLMQFQHPDMGGRTIMLFTAATSADLQAGSRALWDPAAQGGCQGDLVFINWGQAEFDTFSMMVGPSYYLGNPGSVPIINNLINTHPVIFLCILLIILILFFVLMLKLVKRIRKKRMAESNV
jgi:cellulose synthase operon protein B